MKNSHKVFACFSALFLAACTGGGEGQQTTYNMKEGESGGYTYMYTPNDPLNTRIYTLENGLEVYLSDYKATPRIYTSIAVRAGGKFDPETHTGLAHYLEHMLFKGTSRFGTMDYAKEKVLLDSITRMFDYYGTLTDLEERKAYYAQIDKISNEASQYAISNEYDAILAAMGATGTNAYTANDRTVYINNIPANQLENWLEVEVNRFQELTPRLFHTELETVYEEKNRTLDSDTRAVFHAMLSKLFPNHPYGTQTVIGTIEHLKNPSISEIQKYFNTYYRPDNVAICLSGDLDYDKSIALIDKLFGSWTPNPSPPTWESPVVEAPSAPIEEDVFGPEEESVYIGFLQPGEGQENYVKTVLVDRLLSNSQAGLIDLNLVQAQKVLAASSFVFESNDYSIGMLYGSPREGQTLEEVRDLLLEQVDLLRKGEFEDWLIEAIVNDEKKRLISIYERNNSRAATLVQVATNPNLSLDEQLNFIEDMRRITKEDIMAYVGEIYQNYVLVNKRKGERDIPKVEKPQITKVTINPDSRSTFAEGIMAREVSDVQPAFLDYDEAIQTSSAKNNNLPIHYIKNEENNRFSLYYYSDLSSRHDLETQIAFRYLDYLAPDGMTAEEFKKELFKLGCDVTFSMNQYNSYIAITGLSENTKQAAILIENLLTNPTPDREALEKLIDGIRKERENAMQNRGDIRDRLFNYALYGPKSPATHVLSNEDLVSLTPEELVSRIQQFTGSEHRVLYYGPMTQEDVTMLIDKYHQIPDSFSSMPDPVQFTMQEVNKAQVYWTHYNMVQSEIVFSTRSTVFDPAKSALVALYNETFGGGMSGIVFRQLREAQGLAYSTFARYTENRRANEYNSFFGYIGTQADKQPEAIPAMFELIRSFPATEEGFEVARASILQRIRNQRIIRENIFFNQIAATRRELDYDIRQKVFEEVQKITLADIRNFQTAEIKDKQFSVSVLGNRDNINFTDLKKYGTVEELSLEELFGYSTSVQAQATQP